VRHSGHRRHFVRGADFWCAYLGAVRTPRTDPGILVCTCPCALYRLNVVIAAMTRRGLGPGCTCVSQWIGISTELGMQLLRGLGMCLRTAGHLDRTELRERGDGSCVGPPRK
jgi:hypothetical protein